MARARTTPEPTEPQEPVEEPVDAEVVAEEVAPPDPEVVQSLPAVRAAEAIVARAELSVTEVVAQKDKILEIMQAVMKEGVHYGLIPGVNKPSLFKPGAEAINVALRLAPFYDSEKVWGPDDHLTVIAACTLRHIPTSLAIATGEGLCSTRESKYAYRKAQRLCPECKEPQIRRSKYPPKDTSAAYVEGTREPGWYCWKKEGGCGAEFPYNDTRITEQEEGGRIPNEDIPDAWNTVLKMADKRALIAAVLNGTAASDVFTQDVEDTKPAAEQAKDEDRQEEETGGDASERKKKHEARERRVDREPYPIPKSWTEIKNAVLSCDNAEEAWALFEAFIRACSYHLFGEADSTALAKDQRDTMYQKAAGAVVWLHENAEYEGPFMFFTETWQRQAWASVLEGARLEIPDYQAPLDTAAAEAAALEPEEERARMGEGAEGGDAS